MIPTLIGLGLVFGRWWLLSLVVAALGWPLALLVGGVMTLEFGLLGAAGLAVVNAGVGVMIHQFVLQSIRRIRRDCASNV